MPMTGVQGRDQLRDQPQPLGVFCEPHRYPSCPGTWEDDPLIGLKITKSGLLFGRMFPGPDEGSHEAASGSSGFNAYGKCRPVGMRRMRCAVQPDAERS